MLKLTHRTHDDATDHRPALDADGGDRIVRLRGGAVGFDSRVDRITRVARRAFAVAVATVKLLDDRPVLLASWSGPSTAHRVPSDELDARVVASQGLLVVENAEADARFADKFLEQDSLPRDPLPTDAPRDRFYAGCPIRRPDGTTIGVLSIRDPRPRQFSAADRDVLSDLAALVEEELSESVQQVDRVPRSTFDELTFQNTILQAQTEASRDGILMTSADRRIQSFNRRLLEMWNALAEALVGQTLETAIHAVIGSVEDPNEFLATVERIAKQRDADAHGTIRLRGNRTYELYGVPIRRADGSYYGRVIFVHDATRRIRALEALRESEERFRALADAAFEGVAIHENGRILDANPTFATMFGYELGDVIGKPIAEFVAPEDGDAELALNEPGFRREYHLTGLKRDGSRFSIEVTGKSIPYQGRTVFVKAVRDVSARKRTEEALERLVHRHELILNSAADGIVGMDQQGRVTFVNPSAARMTGYHVDEMIGHDLHLLIHHTRADGTPYPIAQCPMSRVLRTGAPRRVTGEVFWRKDGTSFPVEFVSAPIPEGEDIVGAVVTFKDISERLAVERMKDEFISVVSHELRTPLTSIRGSLGLVASGLMGPASEKGQHMLDIAVKNTDRLIALINDILDIERIESGRVSMQKRPCDAADLMVQAAEVMEGLANKAGVRLEVFPLTFRLFVDPDRIVQVLTNLLSNAIKFSPAGSTIWLEAERLNEQIVFRVRDHGRGIPADKLEKIFERFQQVDASDSRDKGGTGLGLAICRSIAQQHGGRIWAESAGTATSPEQAPGSTFYLALPALKPQDQPTVPESVDPPRALESDDDLDLLARVAGGGPESSSGPTTATADR